MRTNRIRLPAVAGTFYPGSSDELQEVIKKYLDEANPPPLSHVKAVIAPHAGYIYSGPIAAYSYKLLADQPSPPKRILLMGPAHRVWFHGVAVADYEAFQTPLGDCPIDAQTIQEFLESDEFFQPLAQAHISEHSLEVQIPFLQQIYPNVPIVPMLFGDVNAVAVGKEINEHLEPDDVIVVSSDLSHYHEYTEAQNLDRTFIKALLDKNLKGVAKGEACGQSPILALMTLAQIHNWEPHLLDYRNSGDTAGDQQHVVGYAAIAYTVEG